MATKKKPTYIYAIGRCREASARVRLFKGKGENIVNDVKAEEYFSGEANGVVFMRPFELTDTASKYYATIRVVGGGPSGQLGAVTLGLARALQKASKDFRAPLKKAGLLTRDPRIKERRKVGTGGKARRKKQSPKR